MDTVAHPQRGDSTFPPFPETRAEINPTLLVCWWCTLFSCAIILVRLSGRWIRTEKLFAEDKTMALSMAPLIIRMILVHFILKWGTNNVVVDGLSAADIARREKASKMVLAARIFYTMFLWIVKLTIADFLHRIYSQIWTRKQDYVLQGIKWFLALTFFGVFVSTLAECQPFHGYWQVVPDPGPACRDSYSQLLTVGILDGITDLLLVVFPLPIIFASNMKMERKISLSLLFSMSLILVAITIYRVQATIEHHYSQRFRSLLASFEILAATGVSNAIVLGSFLRDRGVKKNKFKQGSSGHDSMLDRNTNVLASVHSHPAAHVAQATQSRGAPHVRGLHSWGSDVDLVGELGIRLGPEFHAEKKPRLAKPAPAALPLDTLGRDGRSLSKDWDTNRKQGYEVGATLRGADLDSDDEQYGRGSNPPSPLSSSFTPKVDFFDVGGLLKGSSEGGQQSPTKTRNRRRRQSSVSFAPLPSASSTAPLVFANQLGNSSRDVSPSSPGRRRMPAERLGFAPVQPGAVSGGGSFGGSLSTSPAGRKEGNGNNGREESAESAESTESPFDSWEETSDAARWPRPLPGQSLRTSIGGHSTASTTTRSILKNSSSYTEIGVAK